MMEPNPRENKYIIIFFESIFLEEYLKILRRGVVGAAVINNVLRVGGRFFLSREKTMGFAAGLLACRACQYCLQRKSLPGTSFTHIVPNTSFTHIVPNINDFLNSVFLILM